MDMLPPRRPTLPATPAHGCVLEFWRLDYVLGVRPVRLRFYLTPTPCEEVIGRDGVPYENEWYTGDGRLTGWDISEYLRNPAFYADELAARAEWRQMLENRAQRLRNDLARAEEELSRAAAAAPEADHG